MTDLIASGAGLVGRDGELAALVARLDEARAGSGRLVLCVGEPGIGKTRLAQELAGAALASGTPVAWGRCVEAEGAPAFWPWRHVLRAVRRDPAAVLARDAETPEDRFRLFDAVVDAVLDAAAERALLVVLDDIHWSDEPSLQVLRHLADRLTDAPLLLVAAMRDGAARAAVADLHRHPGVERIELRGFGLAEVREQLGRAGADRARAVLEATGGNPLFVREIARAIAEGRWRPDRPPRTVLDLVGARVGRLTAGCRAFLQTASILGRQFPLDVVAAAVGEPVPACLPHVDEAVRAGLLDRFDDGGELRFVHALTRDAVEASLTVEDRNAAHRAAAAVIEERWAGDLDDHLADLARHWLALAAYGESPTARRWALRAAEVAVHRLAYEEAVRLYRAALALDAGWPDRATACAAHLALGRAAYFAGDLDGAVAAVGDAARTARSAGRPDLVGESALVMDAVADPVINAVLTDLCDEALGAVDAAAHPALRARLLAQRSHLAFYAGDQELTETLSGAALDAARACGDDRALVEALRARQEACPGPAGRGERPLLATEMLAAAGRTGSARTAMWGRLWRIDALMEDGALAAAAEQLAPLRRAAERVGGPVSHWHHDRASACVAQAQGRFGDAAEASRRGYERMRAVEPSAAVGAYLGLQCGLARHVGTGEDALAFARTTIAPPPRFATMGRIARAYLLLAAGLPDEAAAQRQQAGAVATWSWPVFFVVPGHVLAALVAIGLGRTDDLTAALDALEPFRGQHAVGSGVNYLGPAELTLGLGALVQGRLDAAVDDLTGAAERADDAGAPGFAAEARHHLARALLTRSGPGDRDRAGRCATDSERLVRALGMTAFTPSGAELLARIGGPAPVLSAREAEVAGLVAEGLTNRQIARRLVIAERTAGNHVAHILTKLDFTSRSQIAAWHARPEQHR